MTSSTERKTISLSPSDSEEIEMLVDSGKFTSISDVLKTAFRKMKEDPEYRTEIAVKKYKNRDLTIRRAAEIADVSVEEFKDILEKKGISIELKKEKDHEKKVEKLRDNIDE